MTHKAGHVKGSTHISDSPGPQEEEYFDPETGEWKTSEMLRADQATAIGNMTVEELKTSLGENAGHKSKEEYEKSLEAAKAAGISEKQYLEARLTQQRVKNTEETGTNTAFSKDEEWRFEDADTRKEFRLQHQCFLLTYMDKFLGHAIRVNPNGYDYTTCIDGNDPSVFMSRVTNREGVGSLMSAKALDFSQLVPKVRLYKVEDSGKETQVKFHSFSTKPESLLQDKKTRGDDVGLQSVSFDFINQNVAMSERLVEVTVKLLFKSGNDLVSRRPDGFSYLDLFQRSDPGRSHPGYEGYRLKLVVGYEIPSSTETKNFTKDFLKQIKNLDVLMDLNLVDYDINFRENGVLELVLNYFGTVEEEIKGSKFDIFGNYQDIQEYELRAADEQAALDAAAIEARNEEKIVGDLSVEDLGYSEMSEEDKAERKTGYKKTKRSYAKGRSKMLMYKAIINSLVDHLQYLDIPLEMMIQAERDLEEIKVAKFYEHRGRVAGALDNYNIYSNRDPNRLSTGEGKERATEHEGSVYADAQKPFYDNLLDKHYENVDQVLRGLNENQGFQANWSDIPINSEHGANYRLHYFYFGDLIKCILTARHGRDMGRNSLGPREPAMGPYINDVIKHLRENKLRLMLGPIVYDHTFPSGLKRQILTTMGDIPISWDLFLEWFSENFIRPEVTSMNFGTFLSKAVNGLLVNALGPHCFGPDAPKSEFSQTLVTAPPKSDGSDAIPGVGYTNGLLGREISDPKVDLLSHDITTVQAANAYRSGGRVKMDQLPKSNPPSSTTLASKLNNYWYLYVLQRQTSTRRGIRKEDHGDGIYHFTIGQESGLLKAIKFNKVKQKHLAEAMAANTLSQENGTGEGMQLWRPYNAKLDLIGNPLLRPGHMVYIDPTAAGMGDPRAKNSTSRKLGLGGYYQVLRSMNEISPQGWKTDVDTIYQDAGTPHNQEAFAAQISNAQQAQKAADVNLVPSAEYNADSPNPGDKPADLPPIDAAPSDPGKGATASTPEPKPEVPKKEISVEEPVLKESEAAQEEVFVLDEPVLPAELQEKEEPEEKPSPPPDPNKITMNGMNLKWYANQPAWAQGIFDQYKALLPELHASVPGGYQSLPSSSSATDTKHPSKKHREFYVESLKNSLGIYSGQKDAKDYGVVGGYQVQANIKELKDKYKTVDAQGYWV